MKRFLPVLLALVLITLPLSALAGSLSTTGSGTVKVPPDSATLSVGFTTQQPTSQAAQQEAAVVITAMKEAAIAAGVAENAITTSYMNLYPQYNYSEDVPKMRGYSVEHMLSIVVADIEQVGKVLDAVLLAGGNQFGGISYDSAKMDEAYRQALALAVEDAIAKANALAIASGVWLADISEINESLNYSYPMYGLNAYAKSAMDASAEGLGSSLIPAQNMTVTASVTIVYNLK